MFADRARVFVAGGAGGDGAVSFRREAHVPKGGPDGGDGGRGADVVLVCEDSRRDLDAQRRQAHHRGSRGGHGRGSDRYGASAEALEIAVPPGTQAEAEDGEARWDLTAPGQRVVVARGGLGGRGNRHFATSTRQAPRFAERGLGGEERWLELSLKLLADAGLVGLPNAGKSSLLARMTRAHPKVAGYPFTTLEPVLGTLEGHDRQLVLADIPGLIAGASDGAGLGERFLAHVERARLLVHVVDLAPLDGTDPVENHAAVERELDLHGGGLAELPRVLCLSKADLVTPEQVDSAVEAWRERLGEAVRAVLATSAATGNGLDQLAAAIRAHVPEQADAEALGAAGPGGASAPAAHRVYRPVDQDGFEVERLRAGAFRVSGRRVERLLARHDLGNPEALAYVEGRLRTLGVIGALERAGFEPGDDVEIAGQTFELDPGVASG